VKLPTRRWVTQRSEAAVLVRYGEAPLTQPTALCLRLNRGVPALRRKPDPGPSLCPLFAGIRAFFAEINRDSMDNGHTGTAAQERLLKNS